MKLLASLALALSLATPAVASDSAFNLTLNQPDFTVGEDIVLGIHGQPGQLGFLLFDPVLGTTPLLPGLTIDLAISPGFFLKQMVIPASGTAELLCGLDCQLVSMIQGVGGYVSAQAVSVDPIDASLDVSNLVTLDASNDYGFCGSCAPCDGSITDLTLRYIGSSPMYVEVQQKKGKDTPVLFGATLQPFEVFSFKGASKHDKMNPQIMLYLDGKLDAEVHTSCSVPIGPGQVHGSFRILEAVSLDGGPTCPEDGTTPPPATDCDAGKPIQLEFTYTGGDCSASDNDQPSDKATCSGDPAFASQVRIVAYGKKATYVDAVVDLDGTFWVDPLAIGESKIDSNLCVDIYDLQGNLCQALTLHTSCSQPLAVGDIFGGIELTTFVPKP
ncbi:MAG: hypothetical protein P1V81_01100 [Planctomycetota bacterium]|nr:hypothetical protein [Planctomycetota bacterium]